MDSEPEEGEIRESELKGDGPSSSEIFETHLQTRPGSKFFDRKRRRSTNNYTPAHNSVVPKRSRRTRKQLSVDDISGNWGTCSSIRDSSRRSKSPLESRSVVGDEALTISSHRRRSLSGTRLRENTPPRQYRHSLNVPRSKKRERSPKNNVIDACNAVLHKKKSRRGFFKKVNNLKEKTHRNTVTDHTIRQCHNEIDSQQHQEIINLTEESLNVGFNNGILAISPLDNVEDVSEEEAADDDDNEVSILSVVPKQAKIAELILLDSTSSSESDNETVPVTLTTKSKKLVKEVTVVESAVVDVVQDINCEVEELSLEELELRKQLIESVVQKLNKPIDEAKITEDKLDEVSQTEKLTNNESLTSKSQIQEEEQVEKDINKLIEKSSLPLKDTVDSSKPAEVIEESCSSLEDNVDSSKPAEVVLIEESSSLLEDTVDSNKSAERIEESSSLLDDTVDSNKPSEIEIEDENDLEEFLLRDKLLKDMAKKKKSEKRDKSPAEVPKRILRSNSTFVRTSNISRHAEPQLTSTGPETVNNTESQQHYGKNMSSNLPSLSSQSSSRIIQASTSKAIDQGSTSLVPIIPWFNNTVSTGHEYESPTSHSYCPTTAQRETVTSFTVSISQHGTDRVVTSHEAYKLPNFQQQPKAPVVPLMIRTDLVTDGRTVLYNTESPNSNSSSPSIRPIPFDPIIENLSQKILNTDSGIPSPIVSRDVLPSRSLTFSLTNNPITSKPKTTSINLNGKSRPITSHRPTHPIASKSSITSSRSLVKPTAINSSNQSGFHSPVAVVPKPTSSKYNSNSTVVNHHHNRKSIVRTKPFKSIVIPIRDNDQSTDDEPDSPVKDNPSLTSTENNIELPDGFHSRLDMFLKKTREIASQHQQQAQTLSSALPVQTNIIPQKKCDDPKIAPSTKNLVARETPNSSSAAAGRNAATTSASSSPKLESFQTIDSSRKSTQNLTKLIARNVANNVADNSPKPEEAIQNVDSSRKSTQSFTQLTGKNSATTVASSSSKPEKSIQNVDSSRKSTQTFTKLTIAAEINGSVQKNIPQKNSSNPSPVPGNKSKPPSSKLAQVSKSDSFVSIPHNPIAKVQSVVPKISHSNQVLPPNLLIPAKAGGPKETEIQSSNNIVNRNQERNEKHEKMKKMYEQKSRLLENTIQKSIKRIKLSTTEKQLQTCRKEVSNLIKSTIDKMKGHSAKEEKCNHLVDKIEQLKKQLENAKTSLRSTHKDIVESQADVYKTLQTVFQMREKSVKIGHDCKQHGNAVVGNVYKVPTAGSAEIKEKLQMLFKHSKASLEGKGAVNIREAERVVLEMWKNPMEIKPSSSASEKGTQVSWTSNNERRFGRHRPLVLVNDTLGDSTSEEGDTDKQPDEPSLRAPNGFALLHRQTSNLGIYFPYISPIITTHRDQQSASIDNPAGTLCKDSLLKSCQNPKCKFQHLRVINRD